MNTTAAKFQIPDFKFQTCPEFGEGFKVQDSRFQIPNFKFQIKKPQYSSHQHIITSTHQLSTINRQPLFRTTNNEQRTTFLTGFIFLLTSPFTNNSLLYGSKT